MQSDVQLHMPDATADAPWPAAMGVALMVVCVAVAWMIVFLWEIGPVVAVLDEGAGRGLHSGDALAVPFLYTGWLLTAER